MTTCFMPLNAQYRNAGGERWGFLNLNYDARSVALAGASAALPDGGYGIFSNPAALGFMSSRQVVAGYRQLGGGVFGAPLSYAMPVPGRGVAAFSILGFTSGAINVTDIGPDNSPVSTGAVARADAYSGAIAWAGTLASDVAAGVAIKGVYDYLSNGVDRWSADGIVVDGGMLYRSWNSRLTYGFVVHNVGWVRSGYTDEDRYPLPTAIEIGISYVPRYISMMRLSLDLNKKRNDYLLFEPGAEMELVPDQMVVRCGYAVSWRDMEAFAAMLQGESETDYFRANRVTLCAGIGVLTEVISRKVRLDAGIEFSDWQVMPSLVLSMQTEW
ncbi:MAG: PorV/PorQ family protein [Chitinispirillaceae bacterium]|nr:PorV/PorQ family protein [Chitinispirillaceae bacterium]